MNHKLIEQLRKSYKKETNAKVRERLLMMIYTFQEESSRKVADRLQCDQKLVLYWKKRFQSEGIEGLKTRSRSGKPRKLSTKQEEKIKKQIEKENPKNPWTTKRVTNLIKKETKIKYTQRHVQRILRRWKFSLIVPRPTFWQKASKEEIKNFWKKNS